MVVKKIMISLPEWFFNSMLKNQENKSARVQELMIKGFMSEKGVDFNNKCGLLTYATDPPNPIGV